VLCLGNFFECVNFKALFHIRSLDGSATCISDIKTSVARLIDPHSPTQLPILMTKYTYRRNTGQTRQTNSDIFTKSAAD